jgi:hypothetical protein
MAGTRTEGRFIQVARFAHKRGLALPTKDEITLALRYNMVGKTDGIATRLWKRLQTEFSNSSVARSKAPAAKRSKKR